MEKEHVNGFQGLGIVEEMGLSVAIKGYSTGKSLW